MTIEDFEVGTYILFSENENTWMSYVNEADRLDRWIRLTDVYSSVDTSLKTNEYAEGDCFDWVLIATYNELPKEFMI